MMKYLVTVAAVLAMGLAACSSDESTAPPTSEPAADQQAAGEPAAENPATAATTEAPTEVVEESAAEAADDAGEQPILLAQSESPAAAHTWKYTEGREFVRLVPTQPTVGGADKIEVAEVFWYGCPHCFDFEKYINAWAETKPANVRFVRIAATWNPLVRLHAQLFYTEEVLEKNGKIADPAAFRQSVFEEYHQRGNHMTTEAAIQAVFARHGVSAEDFNNTWKSFEVAQKLQVAQDLARRYGVTGVPTIVVNGKYRTAAAEAGGYPELLDVINELIERETLR